jgi:hypothetical protein
MIKMYRTPQALRSVARIFSLVLPPFYAPYYAQVARDTHHLGVGIMFGLIACLCLTTLFESLQILEDPFTAFLALDGIDVHEEFEVLHYAQLVNTRKLIFPEAPAYPAGRRAALTGDIPLLRTHNMLGMPPTRGPSTSTLNSLVGHNGAPDVITADSRASIDDARMVEETLKEHEQRELGPPIEVDLSPVVNGELGIVDGKSTIRTYHNVHPGQVRSRALSSGGRQSSTSSRSPSRRLQSDQQQSSFLPSARGPPQHEGNDTV